MTGDVGSRRALDACFCPFQFTVIAANVMEDVQFWVLSRLPHFLKESLLLEGTAQCLGTMTLNMPLNNCQVSPRVKKHHRPSFPGVLVHLPVEGKHCEMCT